MTSWIKLWVMIRHFFDEIISEWRLKRKKILNLLVRLEEKIDDFAYISLDTNSSFVLLILSDDVINERSLIYRANEGIIEKEKFRKRWISRLPY